MLENESKREKLKFYVAALKPTLAGRAFYACFPKYKKIVVRENMKLVFGKILSEAEIEKLALCFFSHIATFVKEMLITPFMSLAKIKESTEVINEQYLWDSFDHQARGVLILTGHYGNWELTSMGGRLNLNSKQIENKKNFYFIRKSIKNKAIEKFLFGNFFRAGLRIISQRNSTEQIFTALQSNQCVVFLLDQHAHAKERVVVDFFDQKAATYKSLALIARRMKTPVLPARSYRRHFDGKHVLEFFPPIPWLKHDNLQQEIVMNTRQYNEILEQFVLDYPEQWNWLHRRWRNL